MWRGWRVRCGAQRPRRKSKNGSGVDRRDRARACGCRPVPVPTAANWQNSLPPASRWVEKPDQRRGLAVHRDADLLVFVGQFQPAFGHPQRTARRNQERHRRAVLNGLAGQVKALRRAAIAGGEAQAGRIEGVGQQGDMAQPQRAAGPMSPTGTPARNQCAVRPAWKVMCFRIGPSGVAISPATVTEPSALRAMRVLAQSRSVTLCSPGASNTQSPVYQSACSAMSSNVPCGMPPTRAVKSGREPSA